MGLTGKRVIESGRGDRVMRGEYDHNTLYTYMSLSINQSMWKNKDDAVIFW